MSDLAPHPCWVGADVDREMVRNVRQPVLRVKGPRAVRPAAAGRACLLRRYAQQPDRADRAAGRELADREVPREEPGGRTAPRLLRSARYSRRQGRDGGKGRKGAGRTPHRRARNAGHLRPSQGHGRRAGGTDGNAERRREPLMTDKTIGDWKALADKEVKGKDLNWQTPAGDRKSTRLNSSH